MHDSVMRAEYAADVKKADWNLADSRATNAVKFVRTVSTMSSSCIRGLERWKGMPVMQVSYSFKITFF